MSCICRIIATGPAGICVGGSAGGVGKSDGGGCWAGGTPLDMFVDLQQYSDPLNTQQCLL